MSYTLIFLQAKIHFNKGEHQQGSTMVRASIIANIVGILASVLIGVLVVIAIIVSMSQTS
jgi:hypothetical protein